MHRSRPQRTSLYLAVFSGSVAITMATWGLSILGGH